MEGSNTDGGAGPTLEQRRIGQDLHDSVAQELTALNILARDLAETIRTDPAGATHLVGQLEQGLRRSQLELRAVLRGLLPVAVDSAGLMAALSDLADRTQQEKKITCTFHCPEPVSVVDNLAATQLYFIAQEAVHNAVKHAQSGRSNTSVLRMSLPEPLPRSSAEADGVLAIRLPGGGEWNAATYLRGFGKKLVRVLPAPPQCVYNVTVGVK